VKALKHTHQKAWAYNPHMEPVPQPEISPHDATLIDWFLSLTPAQRLAELETRLAFISSAHTDADAQLQSDVLALPEQSK
jgi:hypothetical protein